MLCVFDKIFGGPSLLHPFGLAIRMYHFGRCGVGSLLKGLFPCLCPALGRQPPPCRVTCQNVSRLCDLRTTVTGSARPLSASSSDWICTPSPENPNVTVSVEAVVSMLEMGKSDCQVVLCSSSDKAFVVSNVWPYSAVSSFGRNH